MYGTNLVHVKHVGHQQNQRLIIYMRGILEYIMIKTIYMERTLYIYRSI